MSDCLRRNISVQQPTYCVDSATGTVAPGTAMYEWMAIRAAGPNVLKDTTLCGDTKQLGFVNTNDQEGTQPQINSENYTITTPKLIWNFNPPLYDNANMPDFTDVPTPPNTQTWNTDAAAAPYTNVYMTYQHSSGPISSLPVPDSGGVPPAQVLGDSYVEINWQCRAVFYFNQIQAPAGNQPGLYQLAGAAPVIIQTNCNKYGQLNFYSVLSTLEVQGATSVPIGGTDTPLDLKLYTSFVVFGGGGDPTSASACTDPAPPGDAVRNPYTGSINIIGLQVTSFTDISTTGTKPNGVFLNLTGSLDLTALDTLDPNPYNYLPPIPPP